MSGMSICHGLGTQYQGLAAVYQAMSLLRSASAQPQLVTGRAHSGISVCHVLETLSPRPSCIVSSHVTPAKCFRPAIASDRQGSCQASLSAMFLGLCLKAQLHPASFQAMALPEGFVMQPELVTGMARVWACMSATF